MDKTTTCVRQWKGLLVEGGIAFFERDEGRVVKDKEGRVVKDKEGRTTTIVTKTTTQRCEYTPAEDGEITKIYAKSVDGRRVSPLYSTMVCGGAAHAFDVFDIVHPRDVLVRALGLTADGKYASRPCVYDSTRVTLSREGTPISVHYMALSNGRPEELIRESKVVNGNGVTFTTARSFCCFAVRDPTTNTTLSGHRLVFTNDRRWVVVNDLLNLNSKYTPGIRVSPEGHVSVRL